MSDESNSFPSLRLKPRSRPNPATPASEAPPSDSPAQPAPEAAQEIPAIAPEAPAPSSDFVPPEPPAVIPPPTPPQETRPAPAASSADTLDLGRLKLKPRTTQPEPPVLFAPESAQPQAGAVSPEPSFVVPPPEPPPTMAPVLPPVAPPVSDDSGLPPLAPSAAKAPPFIRSKTPSGNKPPAVAPEDSPAFRAGVWVFVGLIVVALGGIGFLGYRFLQAKNEKKAAIAAAAAKSAPKATPAAKPEAVATAPAPEAKPAPSAKSPLATDHPQSLAGKMVAKAQATIAEREQGGQVKGVNDVLDAGSTPPKPAPAKPATVAETAKSPSTESSSPAGQPAVPAPSTADATAKAEQDAAAERIDLTPPKPKPSAAFRVFVVNARVSGVFQGNPGRVLLNGRMYRVGELVEPKLGIKLVRLDVEGKTLYFEDLNGAEMDRRY